MTLNRFVKFLVPHRVWNVMAQDLDLSVIDLILKQVNNIKSIWEELIKNDSTQWHRGAVRINCDTTRNKYTETWDGDKEVDEMETTAITEMEMTVLNKAIPNYQREHEYETPDVIFYLLSVQFISQNESTIPII